jgi:hypothetical protein
VTSTPHSSDPMSWNDKLDTAAEYLATQVASKQARAIRPALGPPAAWLSGAVRSAVRAMGGKAGTRGSAVEDER